MFIITKDITKLKIAELSLKDRDSIIQRLSKEMPVLHYKVNKEKTITDAWAGHPSMVNKPSAVLSRPLQEAFPNVYQSLKDIGSSEQQVCADEEFTHYIFNDSVSPGFYWVYAIAKKTG
jgi:hypothetical protein